MTGNIFIVWVAHTIHYKLFTIDYLMHIIYYSLYTIYSRSQKRKSCISVSLSQTIFPIKYNEMLPCNKYINN